MCPHKANGQLIVYCSTPFSRLWGWQEHMYIVGILELNSLWFMWIALHSMKLFSCGVTLSPYSPIPFSPHLPCPSIYLECTPQLKSTCLVWIKLHSLEHVLLHDIYPLILHVRSLLRRQRCCRLFVYWSYLHSFQIVVDSLCIWAISTLIPLPSYPPGDKNFVPLSSYPPGDKGFDLYSLFIWAICTLIPLPPHPQGIIILWCYPLIPQGIRASIW